MYIVKCVVNEMVLFFVLWNISNVRLKRRKRTRLSWVSGMKVGNNVGSVVKFGSRQPSEFFIRPLIS